MNTKKLKQLVLDLAIHGKLVPQDPNDEPASELLKRIQADVETRGRASNKSKEKKSAVSSVDLDEVPFEVPEEWCWTTIKDICSKIGSGSTPKGSNYSVEGIPFFRSQNVYNNGLVYDDIKYISEDIHKSMISTEVHANDLLLNITGGSLGRCAVVPSDFERGNVSQHVCILRTLIVPQYLHTIILSDYFSSTMILSGSGREGLPKYSLEAMYIPLPPLAEQHRIVAAIEKWFAVIDELEKNEADLKKSIEQTKKKVLDLAIRGKLVAQNPEDEPAGELLARIRADVETHGRASNKAKGKKSAIPSVDLDEVPFEVPSSWCWTRLDGVCDIKGGKRVPKGMSFSDVPTNHIYIRVTNMKQHTIVDSELKYIDDDVYAMIKNYTISSKDLYLTVAGTIGDVGSVPEMYDGMNLTENAVKLTSIICEKDFLKYALLTDYVQEHFSSKFHQVAQPKLSIETASSAIFPLPPLAEQKRIVEKIEEVLGVLERIEGMM